ncbi:MAG: arginine--tRNA ligase [Clostridiaceae bacterium]|nr:arginine--tRNA ligase [Clostridiaceae bacterium]
MDFRIQIVDWLARTTGLTANQIDEWLEIPPQSELGDYAFPCFRLARTLHKAPVEIAKELAAGAEQKLENMERVQAVNGYLNFFIDRRRYTGQVVRQTLEAGEHLGQSDEGQGKTVIIEFSSPNIAKPFHIGHAFTTILGHALYKIYDRLGYQTVRMNHLGDYGTQFGKLIVAYRLWGDEQALEKNPIQELLRIYVHFHDVAKEKPELEEQARDAFRRLEAGEADEMALWQRFRDLSLKEFAAVYQRLGVSFDNYNGESFYSDRIPAVIDLLKKNNLLIESQGAQVVMLDEYGLPPCIILKSDGTTIYASRDIAAVLYRIEKYHFYKNIYVVGTPQALHFKQVFSVLAKAGIPESADCVHVGFGLVKFPDRKLSTRSGDVIFLSDLLSESVEKTLEIIRQNAQLRQTDMSEEEMRQIAEKIGLGAVTYTFLKNGRERDIIFSWQEMLDFEGDSAPYVQYTYARARSILRKANLDDQAADLQQQDLELLATDDEFALAKLLDGFGASIQKAAELYEPYILVRQITALARAFNKYYNHEPILGTENQALRRARLAMLQAVCLAIRTGLNLVGIEAVERM